MTEFAALSDDERAFEAYMDALAPAMHHSSREQPLRDYCTGLLLPDGRKSVEPIAARLVPGRAATLHKTLLNFVANGSWSDDAVLAAMRRQVMPELEALGALDYWIVDETGMPKKGRASVGVARQYCGELGKVDTCQVVVSLSLANQAAALPVAARPCLPGDWAADPGRRARAGVPLDVGFQTKPGIALDLVRRALADGVAPGVVLADEVYGSVPAFRRGVAALGLDYAVAVRSDTMVGPPRDGRRARLWRDGEEALSVRAVAARLARSAWRWVSWRDGSGPELTGRFAMARVRLGGEGERTLLVEWPVGERDPVGYWLVTLARHTPLTVVVATAKGRFWIEQGYRELKQEVGLGAYEGRGWRGLHHHVTLTLVAYAFLVVRRCQALRAALDQAAPDRPAGGRAKALRFPVVEDPANPPVRPERHVAWSIPTVRRNLTVGLARRLPRCPCCHAPRQPAAQAQSSDTQVPISV